MRVITCREIISKKVANCDANLMYLDGRMLGTTGRH